MMGEDEESWSRRVEQEIELARIRSDQDAARAALVERERRRKRRATFEPAASGERRSADAGGGGGGAAVRDRNVPSAQPVWELKQEAIKHELEATLISTKLALAQLRFERDSLELELRSMRKRWHADASVVRSGSRAHEWAGADDARLSDAPEARADAALAVGSGLHFGTLVSHDGAQLTFEADAARGILLHEAAANVARASLSFAAERTQDILPLLDVLSVDRHDRHDQLHFVGFERALNGLVAQLKSCKAQIQAERRHLGTGAAQPDNGSWMGTIEGNDPSFSPEAERDSVEQVMLLLAEDPDVVSTLWDKIQRQTLREDPSSVEGPSKASPVAPSLTSDTTESTRMRQTTETGEPQKLPLQPSHALSAGLFVPHARILTSSRLGVLCSWLDADHVRLAQWELAYEEDFTQIEQGTVTSSSPVGRRVDEMCQLMRSFPVLVVIRSFDGLDFGAMITSAPRVCSEKEFAPDGMHDNGQDDSLTSSFVFVLGRSNVKHPLDIGEARQYRWTGASARPCLTNGPLGSLFIGDGGYSSVDAENDITSSSHRHGFALWLDASLQYGASYACSTFCSPPLNHPASNVFRIEKVEAWACSAPRTTSQ
ncbi:TLD domain-containing protein 2 [Porphyridium purpureum]|uniref:TLD domain-containing protein 2 n=1 Tax=Porphyridium purpureum TaxID=35688 RepID=A0A5J4Z520_PORPP|nr:TLD domain-containing protein 2 [Porphyridium purpureum]|eukprot:POR6464..scf295_1